MPNKKPNTTTTRSSKSNTTKFHTSHSRVVSHPRSYPLMPPFYKQALLNELRGYIALYHKGLISDKSMNSEIQNIVKMYRKLG